MTQLAGRTAGFRASLQQLLAKPPLQVGFILAAVCLVYLPSLDAYFHGDDFVAMVDVAGKPAFSQLRDVFSFQDHNYYWRPLGQVYYRLIYEIAGLNPFWFRVANLGVFLVSLVLLYKLSIRLGLPRAAALATVLLVGLFANHVVSVAWITNGARLLAALFFLGCLLTLHLAVTRRSLALEAAAWLSFLAACLSDEVAISLAPVPILFSVLLFGKRESVWRAGARGLAYAAVLAALLPLQFIFTLDDEWRLSRYHLSPDMAEQTLALASQLVLPLTRADPMDVWFKDIPGVQWAAGALAIVVALIVFVFGSGLMRFLLVWIAASLAPFTLWDFDVVSPRYTYLAAFPFAVLVPVLGAALLARLRSPAFQRAALLPMAAALAAAGIFGAVTTMERNGDFEKSVQAYEDAAVHLKAAVPRIPPGTRVVVYYGVWKNQDFWLQAMIRTLYADSSITAVNVPPESVPAVAPPTGPDELILYYSNGQLSTRRPLAAR